MLWLIVAVSIASAITSRDTSEYFMPSVPMLMPSVTVITPNICGMPPAARTAASARSASCCRPALHGFIVLWPLAMPTIGFSKSPSLKPTARSIARLGERATPWVMICERRLFGMRETPGEGSGPEGGFRAAACRGEAAMAGSRIIGARNFNAGRRADARSPHARFIRSSIPSPFSSARSRSAGTGSCTSSASSLFVVLGKLRARQNLLTGWHPRDVDDMLFYGVIGVILGGRLGYVLFYKPLYYLAHPLEILQVWQGGMSFHGGFLGVLLALLAVRAPAPQALARGHRLRRAAGAARPRRRAPRQFHQRRAVGARDQRAVGDGVPAGRRARRATRRSSTSSGSRAAAVRVLWLYTPRRRPMGAASGLFLIGYGVLPLHRRIRARARQLPRPARARPVDGPVAVAADDRRRHRDDDVGVPPRGEGRARPCCG